MVSCVQQVVNYLDTEHCQVLGSKIAPWHICQCNKTENVDILKGLLGVLGDLLWWEDSVINAHKYSTVFLHYSTVYAEDNYSDKFLMWHVSLVS